MRAVAPGSSAEVGSSHKRISGLIARRGDTQALLLTAGQAIRRLLQAVLALLPEGRGSEGRLDHVLEVCLFRTPGRRRP